MVFSECEQVIMNIMEIIDDNQDKYSEQDYLRMCTIIEILRESLNIKEYTD